MLVVGAAAFVVWLFPGGGTWRSEVSVTEAELRSADMLVVVVASCNGNPEVSVLRETDREVWSRSSLPPLLFEVATTGWTSLKCNLNGRWEIGSSLTCTLGKKSV
jgi:hypothetical protein